MINNFKEEVDHLIPLVSILVVIVEVEIIFQISKGFFKEEKRKTKKKKAAMEALLARNSVSKEQSRLLEESFRQNHTLNPKQKEALATQLKLRARQVEVWFQNRRARSKLKQTEMECEYLKRWFDSLTVQNRRLQREVEELRAMKVGPPHSSHPLPASTLTMCPRCECVTSTSDKPRPTRTLQSPQPSAAC
ncbi:hypothetical protein LWI29_012459 [Acer saccharum]|uniref:Homeobox domain-containing protein n=1 Tax=Acer saccharum TaxID=4024 RepID=A0AA39RHF7_ACESA|nr:hypothetical protein LWI29_012459 [Acer saccharum]